MAAPSVVRLARASARPARVAHASRTVARAACVMSVLATSLATPCVHGALGAQQAPDTDVWLARLERRGDSIVVGAPANVTRRPGYDNQPSFDAEGATLYFTRRAPNALAPRADVDVQTDIWAMDLRDGRSRPVVETAESEYSPRVTADGRAVIVVRVEADSAQHLWRLPLDGSGVAARLVAAVRPVGYHAWVGSVAVMQVLGAPRTLQVVDTLTGRRDTIASNVGRSIQRIPASALVTYVQHAGDGHALVELDPVQRAIRRLTLMPAMVDDHAWLDDRTVLASDGARLWAWTRGDAAWRVVADWRDAPLRNVTRLAVDPRGRTLALVAEAR